MTRADILTGVLEREGWPKVTDLPSDRGGLTKGGVTFTNYNAWRVKHRERPLTRDEFAEITEDEARTFFEDEFFAPLEFVTDERLFVFLADWAVNAGPDDPIRELQRVLIARGLYTGSVDGVAGPKTREAWRAVEHASIRSIEAQMIGARQDFYLDRAFDADVRAFIATHPTSQLRNLRGWLRRNISFIAP